MMRRLVKIFWATIPKVVSDNERGLVTTSCNQVVGRAVSEAPVGGALLGGTPLVGVLVSRLPLVGAPLVGVLLGLVGCPLVPSSTPNPSPTYGYICNNGTPVTQRDATADNITRCQSCKDGFNLTQVHTCVIRPYVCENGIPSGEDASADNITRCTVCNCGYALSNGVCNSGEPATVTVGTALRCTLTGQTSFNVTLGAPVDGLTPVYQYSLGEHVDLVSIHQDNTILPQARYRTACPTDHDATVYLDLLGDSSTVASICDVGFTLLAPIAQGVHRITVAPTSSTTLHLQIQETGLTQLPFGADTQVGPDFTNYWYWLSVPAGTTQITTQLVARAASGTGNSIDIGFHFVRQHLFGITWFFPSTQVGTASTLRINRAISASNAILLVSISAINRDDDILTLAGRSNRHTIRIY